MNEKLRDWLLLTARLLVDRPEEVEVEFSAEAQCYVLTYWHNPGLLIGRNGEIAASLRRLFKAASKAEGFGSVYLEVRTQARGHRACEQ